MCHVDTFQSAHRVMLKALHLEVPPQTGAETINWSFEPLRYQIGKWLAGCIALLPSDVYNIRKYIGWFLWTVVILSVKNETHVFRWTAEWVMLPLNTVAHQTKSTSRPILFSISKYPIQLTSMNNYEQDRWGLVPSTWWMTLLLSKCSQNGLTNCILEPPNITYLQPSIRSKPVVFQIPPRCLFNIRSTGKPYSSHPVMMFTPAKPSGLRPGTCWACTAEPGVTTCVSASVHDVHLVNIQIFSSLAAADL